MNCSASNGYPMSVATLMTDEIQSDLEGISVRIVSEQRNHAS